VGALFAIARLVIVFATPTLHRNRIAIVQVLHVELRVEPREFDARRAKERANRRAHRLPSRANADRFRRARDALKTEKQHRKP
jgi:hypothetical protein